MNYCDPSALGERQSFEEEFFRLMAGINRQLRQLSDKQLVKDCISPAQLFFLKHLADAGAPQPVSFFADGHFSSRSNASQMIDRLQAEGLVQRQENPQDRRSVLVSLTERGAARLREGHAQHLNLAQALFEPLSEQERESTIHSLRRVLHLLESFQAQVLDRSPLEDAQAKNV